jgi:hypothetical protein
MVLPPAIGMGEVSIISFAFEVGRILTRVLLQKDLNKEGAETVGGGASQDSGIPVACHLQLESRNGKL